MKLFAASVLAAALSGATATAGAQVYDGYPAPTQTSPYPGDAYPSYPPSSYPPNGYAPGYGDADDGNAGYSGGYNGPGYSAPSYDYARVLRVDPVYGGASRSAATSPRCYTRNDGYAGNGYSGTGQYQSQPTQGGRTAATIVGGVVGAVLGSQVGGGSARYATSALGTMAGGMVGQRVYDQSHAGSGRVTVCDPQSDYGSNGGYNAGYYGTGGGAVSAYDVTYEYAGRQYTARTNYNPGQRIRVRVDVQPQ